MAGTLHLEPAELFELAPVPLSVVSTSGRQLLGNAAYRELVGVGEEGLHELDALGITDEADRARTADYLQRLASGEVERHVTTKGYVAADGSRLVGRLTAVPLRDGSGEVVALLGAIQDVTAQHRATEELEQQRRRLELILRNSSDTLSLVDATGRVLESTGRYQEVLGYGAEFWASASIFDLAHPDDLPAAAALTERVLAHPGAEGHGQFRLRHASGGWEHVEVSAVNLLDEPAIGGVVVTSRNVTARHQLEEELARHRDEAVESARRRLEFVSKVSHELRNPLHSLLGGAELLATSALPPELEALAADVLDQAELLAHLVDDLLDHSRIEVGSLRLDPQPTDVRAELAAVCTHLRPLAAPRVQVSCEVAPEVPASVLVDRTRLRQVVGNLLGNAVKFTEAGRARVHVSGPPGLLRVEVSDTGPGLDPLDLPRLLLPFEQGAPARRSGGTGLGLPIVAGLVQLMGGSLTFDGEPGVGTTVVVTLPAPPTAAAPADPAGERHLPAGTVVLVVEDDPVNQRVVAAQLARLGAEARVVGSGEEALDAAEGIDVALVDGQLPGIDGAETARRLLAWHLPPTVPVVGMTASAERDARLELVAAGMVEVIAKPAGIDEIGRALRRALGQRAGGAAEPATDPDTAVLDQLVVDLGSAQVVVEVVDAFLGQLPVRLEALTSASRSGDADAARRVAHQLGSGALQLGADRLGRLCRELERTGDARPTAVQRVVAEAAAAERTLLRWRDRVP